MKKLIPFLTITPLALCLLIGCDDNNFEDAGDNIKDAAEDTADGIEDAAEDTTDGIEDAADDAGDEIEDSTN